MNSNSYNTNQSTFSSSNDILNIPLPMGDPPPQSVSQNTLPAFNVSQSMSFEELAKRADNVMTNTLQEYGPAITIAHPMIQRTPPIQTHAPMGYAHRNVANMPIMPVYPISVQPASARTSTYGTTHTSTNIIHSTSLPQQTAFLQQPMSFTTTSSHLNNPSYNIYGPNNNNSNNHTRNNPTPSFNAAHPTEPTQSHTIQADRPISPPLDALNQNNSTNQTKSADDNKTGGEPSDTQAKKPAVDRVGDCRERIRFMTQNELIQEFHLYERDLDESQRRRSGYERDLADFTRKAHGQNLELNPDYNRKRDLYKMENEICQQYNECLNVIGDLSEKKFANKLTKSSSINQPLQKKIQRPRMSTATPAMTRAEPEKSEEKAVMFEFRDDSMWCKDCDQHFNSLKKFCDHLHDRTHEYNARRLIQPPWKTSLNLIPRKKVYDQYKSICAKLSNKLKSNFSVRDLDEALNPSINDQQTLKNMTLKRERGEFSEDDKLFTMKAYDQLIPIKGFYCKLCNKPLCDFQEAEQHLKSYQHCSEHAKYVALKPNDEMNFRKNLETSRKEKFPSRKSKERSSSQSDRASSSHTNKQRDQARSSSSTREDNFMPNISKSSISKTPEPGVSQFSARLPYKKPTSHIVDEHEVVADKFDKRDKTTERAQQQAVSKTPAVALDNETSKDVTSKKKKDSPKKLRRNEVPEIVPVNKNKPSGALKRLRRAESPEPRVESVLPTVDHLFNDLKSTSEDSDTDVEPEVKNTNERIRRIDEDDEEEGETKNDDDDDVQIIAEVRIPRGDPDSPFPDLEMGITGNHHIDSLRDKRLAKPPTIQLHRMNMDEQKHMMFDKENLWKRLHMVVTKKEPGVYDKELQSPTRTKKTYINPKDKTSIPVDLENSSDEETGEFKMDHLEEWFCDD